MAAGKNTARSRRETRTRPSEANGRANGVDEAQLRELLKALKAAYAGDFAARLPEDGSGLDNELAVAFNKLAERREAMANELARVAQVVDRDGRFDERASLPRAGGSWRTTIDAVNSMIDGLVRPTKEVAKVIDAVAQGDLTKKITVDVKGEVLELKNTINTMVDQLRSFADEVTRVAKEVGTEGKLGGQAKVEGVSGTWKDLTDNVNIMASNLTTQVRNIADVTTAVAQGDLTRKITVDA